MTSSTTDTTTSSADGAHDDLKGRVERIINLIRPAVQADGGDVELVAVTPERIVQVRFHGACVGCPSANMTLQDGIARMLKEKVPEITSVVAVP